MTRNDARRSTRIVSTLRTALTGTTRIVADLLIVGLWVLFLTLLFLSTNWPRWLFYVLLLVGVGLYVRFTAGWGRSSNPDS